MYVSDGEFYKHCMDAELVLMQLLTSLAELLNALHDFSEKQANIKTTKTAATQQFNVLFLIFKIKK